jgi:hypothetical protein
MRDLPAIKRDYQADIHFALGAVIQGVTVAGLGSELATALRNLPFPGAGWVLVTGVQSLLLCIAFWYTFMNNYVFGFRVLNLTATMHLQFASLYLILGLQQLIAIHCLDTPRLWMTLYVSLMATILIGAGITGRARVINRHEVQQALDYAPPGWWTFLVSFALSLACLIIWYAFPALDSTAFRVIALSSSGLGILLFIIYYVQVFQRHLDAA